MADDHSLPPLEDLKRKIDALKPEETAPEGNAPHADYAKGMRMGVDLLAGSGVGLVIGYYADDYFGTAPLLLILFFFIGFAAGVRNILRSVNKD